MMVTDQFVFLHLHKSGGSFVNDCLRRHMPGAREIGYHLPRSLIPDAFRQLPVIGLVRNPWSYYVSWFSFQQQKPRPNALFRVLSDEGRLGFAGTIHNMLDLGRDDTLLSRLLDLLPAAYGSRGLNLPAFALEPIRGSGLGFYSWLYRYMYGVGVGVGAVQVGRMEELPQELLRLVALTGYRASTALREYLLGAQPTNTSRHGPTRSYYDAVLRDRVASLDALVIDRHGYTFDG